MTEPAEDYVQLHLGCHMVIDVDDFTYTGLLDDEGDEDDGPCLYFFVETPVELKGWEILLIEDVKNWSCTSCVLEGVGDESD
jgi:hypothetical protein